jgi:hypothetical protein
MGFNLDLIENIEFDKGRDAGLLERMRKIYPHATNDELRAGLDNLKAYLRVALRIAARLARENSAALTLGAEIPNMKTQRSNPTETTNH